MMSDDDTDPIEEAIALSEEMSTEIKQLKRDLEELGSSGSAIDDPSDVSGSAPAEEVSSKA